MSARARILQDAQLRRLARVKQIDHAATTPLGPEMISFFKQSVEKRQIKLSKIAACWSQLVPEMLNEHCALEGMSRGTLTILVDSASHLYELKQLLLAGLERQILFVCGASGLRKIALRPGRWYEGDAGAARRPRF